MAKIIKIGSATNAPKLVGSFRTARKSTTNPFQNSNFEGNTLQFADIFEGFEPKSTSKLRMIASSVAGSMNKFRSCFAEPIVNFVKRVGGTISSAWDYALNTNVGDIPAIKAFSDFMNTPICMPDSITTYLDGIKAKISGSISALATSKYANLGKNISAKVDAMLAKINHKKISAALSVAELEEMWKAETALELGGAA